MTERGSVSGRLASLGVPLSSSPLCSRLPNTASRAGHPPARCLLRRGDRQLVAHGSSANRLWFKLLARVRGVDRSVQGGRLRVRARDSRRWTVLDILAQGEQGCHADFTVPEGLTIAEVAALAAGEARHPRGLGRWPPRGTARAATRDAGLSACRRSRGSSGPRPTRCRWYDRRRELVRLMAEGFTTDWKPEWNARLESAGA